MPEIGDKQGSRAARRESWFRRCDEISGDLVEAAPFVPARKPGDSSSAVSRLPHSVEAGGELVRSRRFRARLAAARERNGRG
jgi:hypothetical protein